MLIYDYFHRTNILKMEFLCLAISFVLFLSCSLEMLYRFILSLAQAESACFTALSLILGIIVF